jgi:hypothetical protein
MRCFNVTGTIMTCEHNLDEKTKTTRIHISLRTRSRACLQCDHHENVAIQHAPTDQLDQHRVTRMATPHDTAHVYPIGVAAHSYQAHDQLCNLLCNKPHKVKFLPSHQQTSLHVGVMIGAYDDQCLCMRIQNKKRSSTTAKYNSHKHRACS